MSERTYALRKLRAFIVKRGKGLQKAKELPEEEVEDYLFAVKMRVDEDRIIIAEIDRMLKMKQSGRKKKAS